MELEVPESSREVARQEADPSFVVTEGYRDKYLGTLRLDAAV